MQVKPGFLTLFISWMGDYVQFPNLLEEPIYDVGVREMGPQVGSLTQ